jgi:hypothetical protein
MYGGRALVFWDTFTAVSNRSFGEHIAPVFGIPYLFHLMNPSGDRLRVLVVRVPGC